MSDMNGVKLMSFGVRRLDAAFERLGKALSSQRSPKRFALMN